MPLMRLQKFLSAAGMCSRRKGEEYILAGRVAVNGRIVTELGTKIDSAGDFVQLDGNPVQFSQPSIYIALNKPKDYVTSCSHPGEKIVLDLVDIPQRVYPVGRLDKDSTGLLILTNDGRLHHKLSHPSFDHEKEYDVTVAQSISDGALRKLAEGLPMMKTQTRPARVQRISARRFRIVLQEGRNRQVRRMVRKVGHRVTGLKRIRVANIRLGRLPPGAWRHLSESEKLKLFEMLKLPKALNL
ncbi:MAG: rRNA pseudouridine synthase [Deltaproteobacteria bacterium]|jgi:23S rRNA pseudouridine2605 synthase/23S rRNA pseudouridine2604 synthase|nr:rRNA pseudouridine synthase [Deltaproteobacteria bacterium]